VKTNFIKHMLLCFLLLILPISIQSMYADENTNAFYHVSGEEILDENGVPVILKGMSFGNTNYGNPSSIDMGPSNNHTAQSYFELADMGLNHVRFEINYGLFEDDSNPYQYKESGFAWLDQNIAWAKAAGIKLILQMKCPQGGYQACTSIMSDPLDSNAGGKALWIDIDDTGTPTGGLEYQENQQRLVALWTAIAERYKDEPVIIGYGLLNEPVVPELATASATLKQWSDLAQRIADGIRSADTNHILFVERLLGWFNPWNYNNTNWNLMSEPETQILIDDDNTVYEFHFYDPLEYTHQGASWLPQYENVSISYPSNDVVDFTSDWAIVDMVEATAVSEDAGWQYFKSNIITANDSYNFIILQALIGNLSGTTAWFDDLQITKIDSNNLVTVVELHDFSEGLGQFSGYWLENGGKIEWDSTVGHGNGTGAMKVSGASGDWDNTYSSSRVFLEDGCKYFVSGYIKGGNGAQTVLVTCQYASDITYLDSDYILDKLELMLAFGKTNQVPMFVGEWGLVHNCYTENKGGGIYIRDVAAILAEKNIGSNYHSYHDPHFGLYLEEEWQVCTERNEVLYELLMRYYSAASEIEQITYELSSENIGTGSTFDITFFMNNIRNVVGYAIFLDDYDSDLITLQDNSPTEVSADKADLFAADPVAPEDVAAAYLSPCTLDGAAVSFTFTTGASAGNVELPFRIYAFDSSNVNQIEQTDVTVVIEIEDTISADEIVLSASSQYKITEDREFLRSIPPQTTKQELLSNFNNNAGDIYIYDSTGNEVTDNAARIGTGYIVKLITDNQVLDMLYVIVACDVNGDGLFEEADLEILTHYFAGWPEYQVGTFSQYAADMDENGRLTRSDVMFMARKYAGWYPGMNP